MRKITKEAVNAFTYGKSFNKDNMKIKTDENGNTEMYLHGNKIAEYHAKTGKVRISNAGWFSNTTKERLNGILGVSIQQIKGKWYLNDKEWNGEWIELN